MLDAAGNPCRSRSTYPEKDDKDNFLSHSSAGSVLGMRNLGGCSYRRPSPF